MANHPIAKAVYTDEELMALPKDGNKYELIEGEIVMSPAGPRHGRHIMRFSFALMSHVYANGLGELYDGQTGFRLAGGHVLCPDLSFVSATRLLEREEHDGFFEGSPDLAIEVLSPSESKKHADRKTEMYLANQTRLVWTINFRSRTVAVHRYGRPSQVLNDTQMLSGEDVIPGFSVIVASIFPALPK